MSAAAAEKKTWTVEEYLELERSASDKHELFAGEIFAMAGASYEHNQIVGNLVTALNLTLGERCRVLPSDMRLHVRATGLYTYADASVVCDRPELTDDRPPALLNPLLIFEVLSDTTESYDRGKKFENYRTIPSLMHYVLVAQDRVLVEHYARQPDGTWNLREVRAGQRLRMPCGDLPVDPFYRHVL